MRCPSCNSENPPANRFCLQCGGRLEGRCAQCGTENPSGSRFCGSCGAELSSLLSASHAAGVLASVSPIPADVELAASRRSADGERRHLTVLFCDLVGSTEISSRLDPEEWREALADYHREAAEEVARFGGHVAKYLGDGVMALFGYPQAHDNDAERAVRAGLTILDAVNNLEAPAKLSARVGIDSGRVVVGTGAGKDADVFGDAPNIAARVQAVAEPGTLVITDSTHRLIPGLFVVEDRGAHPLKGIDQPGQLYRVLQPSGVRGRFAATSAARGLTPFVGREDELRSLLNCWERALDGDGQVALIIGEAGIGKSRLVQRFHEQIAGTPHTWVEAAAGALFQNTPFYPVGEMLRQFLGDAPVRSQIAQLESRLMLTGLKPAEAVPLVAPLLNLSLPATYPPSALSPEQQRRRLLATLVEWVLGSASTQPLIIATEDLHWIDPSTLELIQLLVEQGAGARLLLLYTARPEFHAPWPLRAHHTQINLSRLGVRDARAMVAQVAAAKALPDDTVTMVVERTGGVPLFVEELTRAVLESGGAGLAGREIPVTLHDSLMARLDRLGLAKEVIQIGAVIGSEFSYELIHAVHPVAEAELQAALRKLADAELVYVRGIAPEATYLFKHALVRDAAYEVLLKSRRKELHWTVGRTIDQKFPVLKERHPEVLARHWTEAGEIDPAITEWSRAGKAAEARHAFKEAHESYQQALTLLSTLSESPERDRRELELRLVTSYMIWITKGWASREAVDAIERAAALAEKSGNLKQLVGLLLTKGVNVLNAGDSSAAVALADRALDLARREGNPIRLGIAHTLEVMVQHNRGNFLGADEYYTTGLKFFEQPGFRLTREPRIAVFAHASWNAWVLGRADVARERIDRMIVNQDNPYDVAYSESSHAILKILMREYEQAEQLARHALELSEKNRIPSTAASSRIVLGQALAHLSHPTEGIVLIRQGINDFLEMGAHGVASNYAWARAEAEARHGLIHEAVETVEKALRARRELAMLRLRGELRLKMGNAELAEADFCEAIALAQAMSAKAWELRVTMSLVRLLAEQGSRDEARAMLAEIYNWFTEGFDTADLKEAKALLDELR